MQIGIDSEMIKRVGKGDRDAIGALFELKLKVNDATWLIGRI